MRIFLGTYLLYTGLKAESISIVGKYFLIES